MAIYQLYAEHLLIQDSVFWVEADSEEEARKKLQDRDYEEFESLDIEEDIEFPMYGGTVKVTITAEDEHGNRRVQEYKLNTIEPLHIESKEDDDDEED